MRSGVFAAGLLFCLVPSGTAEALEIIVGLPYGKHPIGHTAVRVRTFDQDQEVIYDFGRYGRTWGYLGFAGEGVMRVWRGPRAIEKYFAKQTSYRDSVGYTIAMSPEDEREVYRYYESLLPGALWVKRYPLHVRYRLAHDYDGTNYQCTSVALDGLRKVWPRERWESLLDPAFNKGQGFDPETRRFFFERQKQLGLNETVIPLDVIDAFEAAIRKKNRDIVRVDKYPLRGGWF